MTIKINPVQNNGNHVCQASAIGTINPPMILFMGLVMDVARVTRNMRIKKSWQEIDTRIEQWADASDDYNGDGRNFRDFPGEERQFDHEAFDELAVYDMAH